MIVLMMITDGRREYFEKTLASFDAYVEPSPDYRLLVNDSMDAAYTAWLRSFPFDRQVDKVGRKAGFHGAIQLGWHNLPEDTEFVFHLEDDFVLQRPVDLNPILRLLRRRRYLKQVALRRQPWNLLERDAGGVVECHPHKYLDMHEGDADWLEHQLFFTTNPSVYHVSLTRLGWPQCSGSEAAFTKEVLRDPDARFAFWGRRHDDPWVRHIGHEQLGTGY